MVWYHAGKGCFAKCDFYKKVWAKTTEECKKSCANDIRCAFLEYEKEKGKCAICKGDYKRTTGCSRHVEVIAKGTFDKFVGWGKIVPLRVRTLFIMNLGKMYLV